MITERDIKRHISDILTDNGYTVLAAETAEGFSRPCMCVDIQPVSVERENEFTAFMTVTCEITYFPHDATREAIISVYEQMRKMFFYPTFDVGDRHITVDRVDYSMEEPNLTVSFELAFYTDIPHTENNETMQEIEINFKEG